MVVLVLGLAEVWWGNRESWRSSKLYNDAVHCSGRKTPPDTALLFGADTQNRMLHSAAECTVVQFSFAQCCGVQQYSAVQCNIEVQ